MATAQLLQELQQKVTLLTDEQIRLLEQFAELLYAPKSKNEAQATLKRLLAKRARTMSPISDTEVERLATEAVAWARGKSASV